MIVAQRAGSLSRGGRQVCRRLRAGLLWGALGMLVWVTTGCALLDGMQPGADDAAIPGDARYAESLIALDLVNALVQFESKLPQSTLIEMRKPDSAFAEAMASTLAEAGYATRFADNASPGADWFEYEISPMGEEGDGVHRNYYVSVGEIKLKRNYFFQPQGVSPNSSLFVKGADASRLRLNDALFDQGAPTGQLSALPEQAPTANNQEDDVAAVIVDAAPAPAPVERRPLMPGREVPIVVAPQVAEAAPGLTTEQEGRAIALFGLDKGENPFLKRNMAELGGDSNFSNLFDQYRDLSTETLVFPNDSLRLGARGKQQLLDMVELFDASTDIFSVIGCSLGRTSIAQGNEVLATGRARRVVEALLFAGVPRDNIYDEGCWAGRAFGDELPRRGVVVTLKRERPNG